MKLVVHVDLAPPATIEDKAVRHVRTPEGRAKYGQPIGAVITRDVIERAKRREQQVAAAAGRAPRTHAPGGAHGAGAARRATRPAAAGGGERRFTDLDAVRERLRQAAAEAELRGGGKGRSSADFLRKLAADKTLTQSPGGMLVAYRAGRDWIITTPWDGLSIDRIADPSWGGKPAVLDLMRRLETDVRDKDGKPFPWDGPIDAEQLRAWRSDRGETLPQAGLRVTAEHDIAGGHPDTLAVRGHYQQTHIGGQPDAPHASHLAKDEGGADGTPMYDSAFWADGTPVKMTWPDGGTAYGETFGRTGPDSVAVRWSDGSYSAAVDPRALEADIPDLPAGNEDATYFRGRLAELDKRLADNQAKLDDAHQNPHSPFRNDQRQLENDQRRLRVERRMTEGAFARTTKPALPDRSTTDRPAPAKSGEQGQTGPLREPPADTSHLTADQGDRWRGKGWADGTPVVYHRKDGTDLYAVTAGRGDLPHAGVGDDGALIQYPDGSYEVVNLAQLDPRIPDDLPDTPAVRAAQEKIDQAKRDEAKARAGLKEESHAALRASDPSGSRARFDAYTHDVYVAQGMQFEGRGELARAAATAGEPDAAPEPVGKPAPMPEDITPPKPDPGDAPEFPDDATIPVKPPKDAEHAVDDAGAAARGEGKPAPTKPEPGQTVQPEPVYDIPAHRLADFTASVDKANRRAERAGIPYRFTYSVDRYTRKTPGGEDGIDQYEERAKVSLNRPDISHDGWHFLATLTWDEEAGLVTRVRPGEELKLHPKARNCDVCQATRDRKDTYVIRNAETSEEKQVGSNCIAQFLGIRPEGLWMMTYDPDSDEFGGGEDDEPRPGGGTDPNTRYAVTDVLAIALALTNREGFVSRAMASTSNSRKIATADLVRGIVSGRRPKTKEERDWRMEVLRDSRLLTDQATTVRDFAATIEGGEYAQNLRAVAGADTVHGRNVALLVSAVGVKLRADEERRLKDAIAHSKHLGTVGKKITDQEARVTAVRVIDGQYGVTRMLTMVTPEGDVIKWFGTGIGAQNWDIGDRVGVTATVKKHDVYRGVNETVVTRAKLADLDGVVAARVKARELATVSIPQGFAGFGSSGKIRIIEGTRENGWRTQYVVNEPFVAGDQIRVLDDAEAQTYKTWIVDSGKTTPGDEDIPTLAVHDEDGNTANIAVSDIYSWRPANADQTGGGPPPGDTTVTPPPVPERTLNPEDIIRLSDGRVVNVVSVHPNGDIEVAVDKKTGHIVVPPDQVAEVIFPPPPESVGTDGLAGLPDSIRTELTSAYEETGKRYTVQPVAVTASAHEWTGHDAFAVGGNRIRFNPLIADEAWRNESLRSSYTASGNMREAYLHEFAHTLTRRLEQDDPESAQRLHEFFDSHIQKSRDELYSATEIMHNTPDQPDQLPAGVDPDGVLAMSYLVSSYGVENSEEGIAEAFVRMHQGRQNQYVDAVREAFGRYERSSVEDPDIPPVPGDTTDGTAVTPPDRKRITDPDHVTEGARAGDLSPGDRVLLPDADNRLQPAEVTRVGEDDFGDFSIDYRRPDGTEERVALDRSEIIPKLAGDTPAPVPGPDPIEGRDPTLPAVAAGDVQAGDRIEAGDGTSLLVFGKARDRATGLLRISTVDENGKRSSALYPESSSFELASAAKAPDELPAGLATSRPVLATYQRKAVAALDLEAGDNPTLAQAAARVRARQPLSLEQAAALSAELRRLADAEQRPSRKRSLQRNAAQVGAVVTELGGEFTPETQERNKATKVAPGEITEGDQVAVVIQSGPALGKVVGRREILGGRLTELRLRDEQGNERLIMLSRTAPAYLLPDLPDPEPVPEPERPAGTVDRSSVRIGDRIRLPSVGSDAPIEGVVIGLDPEFGKDDSGESVPGARLSIRTALPDGNTVVVSHAVYGADSLTLLEHDALPPEPTRLDRDASRVENVLQRLVGAEVMKHRIQAHILRLPDGPGGRQALLDSLEHGTDLTQNVYYQNGASLARLLAPDASPESQQALAAVLDDVLIQARRNYAERVAAGLRDWPDDPDLTLHGQAEEVLAATPSPDFSRVARSLAEAGHKLQVQANADVGFTPPTDAQREEVKAAVERELKRQRQEFADRITELVKGQDRRTAVNMLTKLGPDAQKPSTESIRRMLVASSYGVDPDRVRSAGDRFSSDVAEANSRLVGEVIAELMTRKGDSPRTTAAAIKAAVKTQDGIDQGFDSDRWNAGNIAALVEMKLVGGGDLPSLVTSAEPEIPAADTTDLAGRVEQLRRLLPGNGSQFGRRRSRVAAFAPTTLAELEAGKAPDIVSTEVFLADIDPHDDGPGQASLRQLEVVRQAGRELDERIQARMDELIKEGPAFDQNAYDALSAQTSALYTDWRRLVIAHEEGTARAAGYPSFKAMRERRTQLLLSRPQTEEQKTELGRIATAISAARSETPEIFDAFQRYSELGRTKVTLEKARAEHSKAAARARSQAALEVLSQVREMGEDPKDPTAQAQFQQKRGEPLKAMKWALGFYPRDWIRRSSERNKGRPFSLKMVARGYAKDRDSYGRPVIALSKGKDQMGMGQSFEELRDVAVHEFGHHMEFALPELRDSERVFLYHRTSEGEVGARTRTGKNASTQIRSLKGEFGRQDEFKEHYSGKEYGDAAYELFTTGVESLFAGSDYLDDDFRHWLLGTLALL
jgi:hypothetical protein